MKRRVVVATTHVDRHFTRLTPEALQQVALDINNGQKPLATIEHDVTIPPRGKGLHAWIEPCGDGEYHQLIVEEEIFDEPVWIRLPSRLLVFKQECESDRSPFADRYKDVSTGFEVAYDPINFDSREAFQDFIEEIRNTTDIEFTEKHFGRKSAVPDPEFLIRLGETLAAILLAKKAIDKISEKVIDLAADDIAKFYSLIKSVIVSAAKYARPHGRPITYIFVTSSNPTIEFVARSTKTQTVLSAMLLDKLEQATSQNQWC